MRLAMRRSAPSDSSRFWAEPLEHRQIILLWAAGMAIISGHVNAEHEVRVQTTVRETTVRLGPPPSATALQVQLNAAIASKTAVFTIPPGEYNFSTVNLDLHEATSLQLVAAGVTLWFEGPAGINMSNCDGVHVIGPLAVNYTNLQHHRSGLPGITYNLLNCTDVVSEDVTIYKAPFFSVTAFNGGGGHIFRRFHLPPDTATLNPDPYPHQRDAFHFTDLRRGVVLEDSDGGYCGDDFLNSHNTVMVVLEVESPTSLLLINPHLQNVEKGRNTVYGTNCVLENLREGDEVHFFAFGVNGSTSPAVPLGGASVVLASPVSVSDQRTLAAASTLSKMVTSTHSTEVFVASDVWRVQFTAGVPTSVGPASLVNLDAFSTPGTVVRNNTFVNSVYNLGRFKSNGGQIVNNTFSGAHSHNLEITPLLSYFEGTLSVVRDVLVAGNTFIGEGTDPIHCNPFCNNNCQRGWRCGVCADCAEDTPWAVNITVIDNKYTSP